jgi:hypothetical protein
MSAIEERLETLERNFAEIKKLNGIPGARGPAGSIEAACQNATEAAKQQTLSVHAESVRQIADLVVQMRRMLSDLNASFRTTVQERVAELNEMRVNAMREYQSAVNAELESAVARGLHDYGVLEDGSIGQLLKYEIEKAVDKAAFSQVQQ